MLYELKLNFVVAIHSHHAVWLPREQQVRCNRWRQFERVFSGGQQQTRSIRAVIFGRQTTQFWQITTEPQSLPQIPRLSFGFVQLIGSMNQFKGAVLNPYGSPSFLFSSA